MSARGPRWLYLHGFGSGPGSAKGVFLARHFARLGIELRRLDLRVPSMEGLLLSATIDKVRQELGGAEDRAVVFGSSLGGLAALRLAEQDARIGSLVLLAPALRFAERWAARPEFERWRASGWIDAFDYAERKDVKVHFDFATDAMAVDARGGGWPDVRVPCLIIHGIHDDTVEIERSRQWASGKRHVRLLEVDDGHDLARSLALIAQESERFLAPYLGAYTGCLQEEN